MAFAKLSGSLLASRNAAPAKTMPHSASMPRHLDFRWTISAGLLLGGAGIVAILMSPLGEADPPRGAVMPVAASAEAATGPSGTIAGPESAPPVETVEAEIAPVSVAADKTGTQPVFPAPPSAPDAIAEAEPAPAEPMVSPDAAPVLAAVSERLLEAGVMNPIPASAVRAESPAPVMANSALLARGDALFVTGDVASARLFYERAANAGDGQAALRLGETYDPAFLARTRFLGAQANAGVAAHWYRRAQELGVSDADILLNAIAADTRVAR